MRAREIPMARMIRASALVVAILAMATVPALAKGGHGGGGHGGGGHGGGGHGGGGHGGGAHFGGGNRGGGAHFSGGNHRGGMAFRGGGVARSMPAYRGMRAHSVGRMPGPALAMRQSRPTQNIGTARGYTANANRYLNNNQSGMPRSSMPSNRATSSANLAVGSVARPPRVAGPMFSGWGSGNVGGFSGYRNRGYGSSGWGYGYGRGGYGYGSGYGNNGYGMGNGQYVWIFIPALGWVYVPIRLLLLLGL